METETVRIVLAIAATLGVSLAAAAYIRRSVMLLVLAGFVAVTAAGFAVSALVLA